jgi:uncharacterized protein with HEPN domain
MTLENFGQDRKTVDAVIRNMTIIGEAAAHIPGEVTAAHPEVQWREMRAMRNLMVHQYFGVSDRILWDTVSTNLPPLAESIRRMLEAVR